MKTPHDDSEIETLIKDWNPPQPPASEEFVNNVMRRVNLLPIPRPWWKSLFDLYHFSLRPVTAIAAIFILGIGLGYWMNRTPDSLPSNVVVSQEEKPHLVKFIYVNPNAKSVDVVGDFNNWQKTPLLHQDSGLWTLTLPMAEGEYNYQFVIDGKKFVEDPTASEKSDDGFGQTNSVLSL